MVSISLCQFLSSLWTDRRSSTISFWALLQGDGADLPLSIFEHHLGRLLIYSCHWSILTFTSRSLPLPTIWICAFVNYDMNLCCWQMWASLTDHAARSSSFPLRWLGIRWPGWGAGSCWNHLSANKDHDGLSATWNGVRGMGFWCYSKLLVQRFWQRWPLLWSASVRQQSDRLTVILSFSCCYSY